MRAVITILQLTLVAVVGASVLSSNRADGATNTWVGEDSATWNTKTNWSLNYVPGGDQIVRFSRKSGTFNVVCDSSPSVRAVTLDESAYWRITGSAQTLTVAEVLEFVGNSTSTQQWFEPHLSGTGELVVDGAWLGLFNNNTFTGGTTVFRSGILYGQALTGGDSPFGPTNCLITLRCGALRLSATNTTTSTSVGAMTIDGRGRIQVNAGSFSSTTTLSMASLSTTSTSRDTAVPGYSRDVLYPHGAQGSLGDRERIVVSSGMTATNKLPGWHIVSQATPGSTSADFASYSDTTGFGKFTNYATADGTWSNVTNSDTVVYNSTDAALSGSKTVWGIKTYSDPCMLSGTATINIGPGGIIVAQTESHSSSSTKGFGSGITIAFGDNEGNIFTQHRVSSFRSPYDRSGPQYCNRLFLFNNVFTGNNGLTIHGPGLMMLENDTNIFAGMSGPITVHDAWLICLHNVTFTNDFVMDGGKIGCGATASLIMSLNGKMTLVSGGLLIAPDISVGWTVNLNGKITGPGALSLDCPSTFYLNNPTNDYSGGTFLLSLVDPVEVIAPGALGSGPIDIASGATLNLNASVDSDWSLTNGLSGYGTVQVETGTNTTKTLTITGRTISPGDDDNAGTLTIKGRLKLDAAGTTNSTLLINLNATNDCDKLKVNGALVTLENVNLSLTIAHPPTPDETLYILLNGGNAGISGTFAGLPEGSRVNIMNSRYQCRISYIGNGDGGSVDNDVKLFDFAYIVPGTQIIIR